MNHISKLLSLTLIFFYSCSNSQGKINPEAVKLNDAAVELHMNSLANPKGQSNRNKVIIDAIALLDRATKMDTNYFTGYSNKLIFQNELKQYKGALQAGKQMIRLRPKIISTIVIVGELSEKAGDAKSSIFYYHKALVMYNGVLDTMNNKSKYYNQVELQKGILLILLNKQSEATAILKRLSETDPILKDMCLQVMNISRNGILNGEGAHQTETTSADLKPITH